MNRHKRTQRAQSRAAGVENRTPSISERHLSLTPRLSGVWAGGGDPEPFQRFGAGAGKPLKWIACRPVARNTLLKQSVNETAEYAAPHTLQTKWGKSSNRTFPSFCRALFCHSQGHLINLEENASRNNESL